MLEWKQTSLGFPLCNRRVPVLRCFLVSSYFPVPRLCCWRTRTENGIPLKWEQMFEVTRWQKISGLFLFPLLWQTSKSYPKGNICSSRAPLFPQLNHCSLALSLVTIIISHAVQAQWILGNEASGWVQDLCTQAVVDLLSTRGWISRATHRNLGKSLLRIPF